MNEMQKETLSLSCVVCPTEYDVLVVGGGTAGVMAAIAAAECGKKVLITEREYALGGSATLAQVTPLMTVRVDGVQNSYISRRLQDKLVERGYDCLNWRGESGMFSPVMLRCVLEEMATEAGVEILYGAAFVQAQRTPEGDRLQSVMLQTLNGPMIVRARTFVDGTGNAQVAFDAGCPLEIGRKSDGKNQDMSLRFMMGGIDEDALLTYMNGLGLGYTVQDPIKEMASLWVDDSPLTDVFRRAERDGVIRHEDGIYFQCFAAPSLGRGVMYFNCPEAAFVHNAVDARSVTQVVLDCRQSAVRLHRFLKEYIGGFENSVILAFAELPGIRESRRILGAYQLTEEDYYACRKFEDAVAQTAYPIDIHDVDALDHQQALPKGAYLEVPYRCLVPQGLNNLLVAGRSISASFVAQSAIRIQLVCRALGEAAGIGAALACETDGNTAAVDGARVRAIMVEKGGLFL